MQDMFKARAPLPTETAEVYLLRLFDEFEYWINAAPERPEPKEWR